MKGRGLEVLAMIYCEIEREGIPPTIREICEEFGIKSTNGARHWLRQLEARGFVTRKTGISRGLQVTPAGAAEVSRYLAELADELESKRSGSAKCPVCGEDMADEGDETIPCQRCENE